jgi:hypothetical protein
MVLDHDGAQLQSLWLQWCSVAMVLDCNGAWPRWCDITMVRYGKPAMMTWGRLCFTTSW